MATLGQAISKIRGDINRDTNAVADSVIQEALVNAIRFYRARRYAFNTKTKVMLLAGEFTSLTANFMEIDYAKLQVGARYKPLVERDYIWLNEQMRFQSLSAEPRWYAIQDRNLRVYPPPDQSYSCEIHYLYDLSGISLSTSDTATTNSWFDEAYEVIRLHAEIELLETYLDGPDAVQKAQVLRNREIEAERELKRTANRQQSSGQIRGRM